MYEHYRASLRHYRSRNNWFLCLKGNHSVSGYYKTDVNVSFYIIYLHLWSLRNWLAGIFVVFQDLGGDPDMFNQAGTDELWAHLSAGSVVESFQNLSIDCVFIIHVTMFKCTKTFNFVSCPERQTWQGHHHNGDQAARRPNMMHSISGRRFSCSFKGGLFAVGFGVRGNVGVGDGPIR